jgi:lipopolysaccharide biosynthesis protein
MRVNSWVLGRALHLAKAGPKRLVGEVRGLLSLLRRRKNYIAERWPGLDDRDITGRVCIFVHFDRRGEVHDFVVHYLKELKAAGFTTIFVSNAPKLKPAGLRKIEPLAKMIVRRDNLGYDFGAYKDGISLIPDLGKIDLLLLANDSVYGPFWPLSSLLSRADRSRSQFWGLTDCWDRAYHLQSYFLLFGQEAINSEAFRKFWRKIRYVNSKSYIIRKYEVGLSQTMAKAGLRGTAFFTSRAASRAVIETVRKGSLKDEDLDDTSKRYLTMLHRSLEEGAPLNMSHYLWDYLIVEMGYPFIKRDLLQKNPVSIPYLARWPEVIGSVSDYDTDLIVRHLETSLKNRFI